MGILSGIAKSFVNPMTFAQLAMGPAGWASIAGKALFSAIGQQVVQALGEKLGLPQSIIDGAQAAFCAACGDKDGAQQNVREAVQSLAQDFNLSPLQEGQLERGANDSFGGLLDSIMTTPEYKEAKQKGGGSWLMAIARTLGEKTNKMAADLEARAGKLGKEAGSKENIEYAAKSQEFGMLFNGSITAIKTIGEALQAGARKQ